MHPFLRVSFSFFSQNKWLDSRGVVSPNQWLSRYLVFGGLHQNRKITARETMELNTGSQVRLQAGFLPPGKSALLWNFPSWFCVSHGNLSIEQLWGLSNGSNGSSDSLYFTVICPQSSCTEGQGGGLGLKTKDSAAQLTLLPLHMKYNLHSSLYLTPGTAPNCTRKTEIYVMGTKYNKFKSWTRTSYIFTG